MGETIELDSFDVSFSFRCPIPATGEIAAPARGASYERREELHLPRMAIPSTVPLAAPLHLVEKLTGYDRGHRNSDPLIATARHNPRGPERIVGERISILPHLPPGVEVADSGICLVP